MISSTNISTDKALHILCCLNYKLFHPCYACPTLIVKSHKSFHIKSISLKKNNCYQASSQEPRTVFSTLGSCGGTRSVRRICGRFESSALLNFDLKAIANSSFGGVPLFWFYTKLLFGKPRDRCWWLCEECFVVDECFCFT